MLSFPFLYSFQRKSVIGILRHLRVDVDDDERQNHFLQADLIYRPQTTREMCRRIDMCAPLPHVRKVFNEESVPIKSFPFLVRQFRPVRNSWLESMRQIDEFFRDKNFLNAQQGRVRPLSEKAGRVAARKRDALYGRAKLHRTLLKRLGELANELFGPAGVEQKAVEVFSANPRVRAADLPEVDTHPKNNSVNM